MRIFAKKEEMEAYLGEAGFKHGIEFKTNPDQDKLIYNAAINNGKNFNGYNLINNSCGIFARGVLTVDGSGIKPFNPWIKAFSNQGFLSGIANNAIPKSICADMMLANKYEVKKY